MTTPHTVQPFPYASLSKFTLKEAELLSMLARHFPARGYEPEVAVRIGSVLDKYLGKRLRIQFESLFDASFKQFVAALPEHFVCLAVSLTPLPKKVIIELDFEFLFVLIDTLLGGSGKVEAEDRPLTPLEEGALQFLAVRVLKELNQWMAESPYKLRFDKIFSKPTSLSIQDDEASPVVLLTLRLTLGDQRGYVRFCLPKSLLMDLESRPGSLFDCGLKSTDDFEGERIKNFWHYQTVVWAEAGRVALKAGELNQLEKGDILLLDETYPHYDGRRLSGGLRLRIGDGLHGGLDAAVTEEGDSYRLRVDRIVGG